jgi:hypothetical protein
VHAPIITPANSTISRILLKNALTKVVTRWR